MTGARPRRDHLAGEVRRRAHRVGRRGGDVGRRGNLRHFAALRSGAGRERDECGEEEQTLSMPKVYRGACIIRAPCAHDAARRRRMPSGRHRGRRRSTVDAESVRARPIRRRPSRATVIRNATILTAAGPAIERGSILLQNGKVAAVGQTVERARPTRSSSTPAASGSRPASSTRTRTSASTPRPASSRCRTATR